KLGIVAGEHARGLDESDAAAEPAVRLRHFHAGGAAADDNQMIGALRVLEDRLIGEAGCRLDAGNRRHGGTRAGGDDDAPGPDFPAVRTPRAVIPEARMAADHGDAERLEARD